MVERGEYQGKPTINLKRNATDRFGFCFGLEKAKMILAHLEEIKAFVTENQLQDKDKK